jgi:hypothetical protein
MIPLARVMCPSIVNLLVLQIYIYLGRYGLDILKFQQST